jgi:hypothetical protein
MQRVEWGWVLGGLRTEWAAQEPFSAIDRWKLALVSAAPLLGMSRSAAPFDGSKSGVLLTLLLACEVKVRGPAQPGVSRLMLRRQGTEGTRQARPPLRGWRNPWLRARNAKTSLPERLQSSCFGVPTLQPAFTVRLASTAATIPAGYRPVQSLPPFPAVVAIHCWERSCANALLPPELGPAAIQPTFHDWLTS